MSRHQL